MIGIYKLAWCITLFIIHNTGYTGNTDTSDTSTDTRDTGIYILTLDTMYMLTMFSIINMFSVFLFEYSAVIHTVLSVISVFLLTHKPTVITSSILCIIYIMCIVYMLTTIFMLFFKKIHDIYLSYISSNFCHSCRYSEEICICPKNFYGMKPDPDTHSIASSA